MKSFKIEAFKYFLKFLKAVAAAYKKLHETKIETIFFLFLNFFPSISLSGDNFDFRSIPRIPIFLRPR